MFRIPGIISLIQKEKKGKPLSSDDVIIIGSQIWRNRKNPALLKCVRAKPFTYEGYIDNPYEQQFQPSSPSTSDCDLFNNHSSRLKTKPSSYKVHSDLNADKHQSCYTFDSDNEYNSDTVNDDNSYVYDLESQTTLKKNANKSQSFSAAGSANEHTSIFTKMANIIFQVDNVSDHSDDDQQQRTTNNYTEQMSSIKVQYRRPKSLAKSKKMKFGINHQHNMYYNNEHDAQNTSTHQTRDHVNRIENQMVSIYIQ